MILSVSRRTDIPNYYSEWFFNRIKEGFVYVRNPMNPRQVSKILLSPEVVDCIVFWTKNPEPMLARLPELSAYHYYFQFTLTGYGRNVERNVPHKKEKMIPVFQRLSEQIGSSRVIWRYDPILFTKEYTPEYHLKAFSQIAEALKGYTDKCVISFVDTYTKNQKAMRELGAYELRQPARGNNSCEEIAQSQDCGEEMAQEEISQKQGAGEEITLEEFASKLSGIARANGMSIATCAESLDLQHCGIGQNSCIDKELIEAIIGCPIKVKKDKNQRPECGCVESIDIGTYNTCLNGCVYCYANHSPESVRRNCGQYDVKSPILCGQVTEEDRISEREVMSLREEKDSQEEDIVWEEQMGLF